MADENVAVLPSAPISPLKLDSVDKCAASPGRRQPRQPLVQIDNTHAVNTSAYDVLRELDELENWRERNEVITSQDHQNNWSLVTDLLNQLLDSCLDSREVSKPTDSPAPRSPLVQPVPSSPRTSPTTDNTDYGEEAEFSAAPDDAFCVNPALVSTSGSPMLSPSATPGRDPRSRPSAAVVAMVRSSDSPKATTTAASTVCDVSMESLDPGAQDDPAAAAKSAHTDLLWQQEQLLQRDRMIDQLKKDGDHLSHDFSVAKSRSDRVNKMHEAMLRALNTVSEQAERVRNRQSGEMERANRERDEAFTELDNMRAMYSDLNRKFERTRVQLLEKRQCSELGSVELQETMDILLNKQRDCDRLQQQLSQQIDGIREEQAKLTEGIERERLQLSSRLRLRENKVGQLEQENSELTEMCNEIIRKMDAAN